VSDPLVDMERATSEPAIRRGARIAPRARRAFGTEFGDTSTLRNPDIVEDIRESPGRVSRRSDLEFFF
jgi:hypothetical protein